MEHQTTRRFDILIKDWTHTGLPSQLILAARSRPTFGACQRPTGSGALAGPRIACPPGIHLNPHQLLSICALTDLDCPVRRPARQCLGPRKLRPFDIAASSDGHRPVVRSQHDVHLHSCAVADLPRDTTRAPDGPLAGALLSMQFQMRLQDWHP